MSVCALFRVLSFVCSLPFALFCCSLVFALFCLLPCGCSLVFALFCSLSCGCSLFFALFCLLSFVFSLFCGPPFPTSALVCSLVCRLPLYCRRRCGFLKILSFLAANNAGFAKMLTSFHFYAVRIGRKNVRDKKQDSCGECGRLAENILPVVAIIIDFFVGPQSPF